MTRKDYEAIAEALGTALAEADRRVGVLAVDGVQESVLFRLTEVFEADNARFASDRFAAAVREARGR